MIAGRLCQIGNRDDIYYRPASLEVARFLRNQNIYDMTVTAISENGSLHLENGIKLTTPACQNIRVGDRIAAGIRAEEVVIIRPNKPISRELQNNLFRGTLTDMLAFGGTHTLTVVITASKTSVNVELPNCAMRDLGFAIGDELQVCLRQRSLWTLKIDTEMRERIEVVL
jgi:molybdate transport system ATP-binding protein